MTEEGSLLFSVCLFRYICLRVSVHSRLASIHSTLDERLRKRRVVIPAKFNNASAPSTIFLRSSASSLQRLKHSIKKYYFLLVSYIMHLLHHRVMYNDKMQTQRIKSTTH